MSKTKIIATLGPASFSKETIKKLVSAGVDLFRLNMSHEAVKDGIQLVQTIRQINKYVGIIVDLQGPRIRTGKLKNGSVVLKAGDEITVTTKDIEGDDKKVSTDFKDLPSSIKPGQRLLIDNGMIELQVIGIKDTDINCKVVAGGHLGEHKGINLPGVSVFKKALTEKDKEDIKFACSAQADYIALSFTKSAHDVLEAKKIAQDAGCTIPVIAKIENQEAVSHLEEIIGVSDAIMVARGDLGVELPPEDVPIIQKDIIKRCAKAGKPVIVASQMLETMVENPRPTRAESTDVANAIFDSTDSVMLSEETASGKYPVESVEMMTRIINKAEEGRDRQSHLRKIDIKDNISLAVSHAAVHTSEDIRAKAIISFTTSGSTALMVSKWRPACPIIASVTSEKAARKVSLYWGVKAIIMKECKSTDEMIVNVEKAVLEQKLLKSDDLVIITAGVPIGQPGTTNLIKVHKIS